MNRHHAHGFLLVVSLVIIVLSSCTAPAAALEIMSRNPYKGAIAVDAATGTVLFEDNADAEAYPASVTKLMVLLVMLEAVEEGRLTLDDRVKVTSKSSTIGGSQVYLKDNEVERIFVHGCPFMMMECSKASKPFGVKTIVSLTPLMVDGTGMCGACRVEVGGETKFACVDGPDFDGHEVNWDTLSLRLRQFIREEDRSHMLWERDNWHKLVETSPQVCNPTLGRAKGEVAEKKCTSTV